MQINCGFLPSRKYRYFGRLKEETRTYSDFLASFVDSEEDMADLREKMETTNRLSVKLTSKNGDNVNEELIILYKI